MDLCEWHEGRNEYQEKVNKRGKRERVVECNVSCMKSQAGKGDNESVSSTTLETDCEEEDESFKNISHERFWRWKDKF